MRRDLELIWKSVKLEFYAKFTYEKNFIWTQNPQAIKNNTLSIMQK